MNLLLASLVLISEIAWAGSAASLADEWFEIANVSDQSVDLTGWSVEGASSDPIVLPDGAVVASGSTYLVANYPADEIRSTLDVAPDLVTTAVSLSNSALQIRLYDAEWNLVDTAGDGAAPLAGASGDTKTSMERLATGLDGSLAESWISSATSVGFDAGATELGTPGSYASPNGPQSPPAPPSPDEGEETDSATTTPETSDPDPVPDAPDEEPDEDAAPNLPPESAVRVSEIYASPKPGGDEWLEVWNRSDQGEFLDGFVIRDASGASTKLEGLLLPWNRIVIVNPKGSLNNGGDTVVLIDAVGREVDRVVYGRLKDDESYARVELQDRFAVTVTPTPGEANVITERQSPPAPSSPQPAPVIPVNAGTQKAAEKVPDVSPVIRLAPTATPKPSPSDTSAKASVKKTPAPKPNAAKAGPATNPKSRFKGSPYVATVAIPPGVYAKTRFQAFVNDDLREVRLTKSMASPPLSGARLHFIAQEKTDDERRYLQVNPNSITFLDDASEMLFEPRAAWPETSAAAELDGEVTAVETRRLTIAVGGREGFVELPPSLSKAPMKTGDVIRVRGFVETAEAAPIVWLPDAASLTLVKGYQAEATPSAPKKLPFAAMSVITAVIGTIGILAYLRRERLRRELMLRRDADLTMEE